MSVPMIHKRVTIDSGQRDLVVCGKKVHYIYSTGFNINVTCQECLKILNKAQKL